MKRIALVAIIVLTSIQPLLAQEKPQESKTGGALRGTLVYANGTKKQFSDFRGLEQFSTGPYSVRYEVRPGKLFFEADNPTRIVTVELEQVALISFGNKPDNSKPIEIKIVFKDGTKESFLSRETCFDVVWAGSKLTERHKVYFSLGDCPYFGASISF